jgi:hypothetical protein
VAAGPCYGDNPLQLQGQVENEVLSLNRRLAMALRSTITLTILVPCVGRAPLADEAKGVAPQLRLGVELDRREFLPGEPVLIGLSIENLGSEAFADLANLEPRQEFISFRLIRDGKDLPWTAHYETWFFQVEGAALEPGGRLCNVVDLLDYFGSPSTISLGKKSFRFKRCLAPGSYSLLTRFRARMGVRQDLPRVVVEGNQVDFVVKDASAIPAFEESALDLLESSSRSSARPRIEGWKDVSERGLGQSRYLMSLTRWFPLADTVDVVAFANEYVSRGGGNLAGAALVVGRYWHFGNRLNAAEAWLNGAARKDAKGLYTCFLRTYQRYVARAREYGRGED